MNGTIYDFAALPRLAFEPSRLVRPQPRARRSSLHGTLPTLTGLICNPRSHAHRAQSDALLRRADVLSAAPATRAELLEVLAGFAERGIDLLAIEGGDGTIRDVLTCAGQVWGADWPEIALLPTGKTNALAIDLGVPSGWTLDDALAAAARGSTTERAPIVIERSDGTGVAVRGFLFGAGAFVDATELAQHTHRAGAFNGLAVALALGWGVAQTLFGAATSKWRAGSGMRIAFPPDARALHGAPRMSAGLHYILLTSTLERLPLGLKPFGAERAGMKTLFIDAPPRQLLLRVAPLLRGSQDAALEAMGYHRVDSDVLEVKVDRGFILDGELFPAGAYRLARAAPLRFVTP